LQKESNDFKVSWLLQKKLLIKIFCQQGNNVWIDMLKNDNPSHALLGRSQKFHYGSR